ncbi:MAG: hypothetical protein MK105_14200 [Crocinitomicaceae bacterium]|nr:hypothetical protein [Crocinitomicaceae bacterium]
MYGFKMQFSLPANIKWVLWIVAASFMTLYLVLSFNNRAVSDDIVMLNDLEQNGIWNAIFQFNFNKRITGHFLFYSLFSFTTDLQEAHYYIFTFHIITITSLIYAFQRLIKDTSSVLLNFKIRTHDAYLLSILTIAACFFFTFQLNEVWFWTIASAIHLIPVIFVLLSLTILMKHRRKSIHYLMLFIYCIIIGGMSETVTASFIACLLVPILLNMLKRQNKQSIPYMVAIIGLFVFFIPNIFGGGSDQRVALEIAQGSDLYIDDFTSFFMLFIVPKNAVFLLFVIISYIIGNFQQHRFLNHYSTIRIIGVFSFLIILVSATTFFPLVHVFGNLGPQRAWTPFGFTLGLSLLLFSFIVGNRSPKNKMSVAPMGFSLLIVVAISLYTVKQFNHARLYSSAYDQRTINLLKKNAEGQQKPLAIDPLPDSGMLINSEIENDPQGWHNYNLMTKLHLNYQIYQKN